MLKKQMPLILPILIFLAAMIWLLIAGEQESGRVRDEVVRYHVVGHSDGEQDQQVKLLLRDHLFEKIESLFADCADREEALAVAKENQATLEREGEAFLRGIGEEKPVRVVVGERFFPTKAYGSLSFPAGRYQAVSILIGEGKGENFWCVLYPALCLSPAIAKDEGAEKIAMVVGEAETNFLQKEGEIQKVKFRLVEWFENLREKLKNS